MRHQGGIITGTEMTNKRVGVTNSTLLIAKSGVYTMKPEVNNNLFPYNTDYRNIYRIFEGR